MTFHMISYHNMRLLLKSVSTLVTKLAENTKATHLWL